MHACRATFQFGRAAAVPVADHKRELHVRQRVFGEANRRSHHQGGPDGSGRSGRVCVRLLHEAAAHGVP
eukprot:5477594-Pyramimonas_sp.AAC.1